MSFSFSFAKKKKKLRDRDSNGREGCLLPSFFKSKKLFLFTLYAKEKKRNASPFLSLSRSRKGFTRKTKMEKTQKETKERRSIVFVLFLFFTTFYSLSLPPPFNVVHFFLLLFSF